MSTTRAIEVRDLEVRYGSGIVIDGLDLQVETGEFLCLLGPSGCGKSTLLRNIGGLATHARGAITVNGRREEEGWEHLAYVFQAPRLVPWRSALANVVLGLELRGGVTSRAERRKAAQEAMRVVGVEHLADRPAHLLSGGEQQRVAIARALAVQPDVLLMDEPLSALDVTTRRQLRAELVSLWRRTGLTIVFVTHDVDEAIAIGSRIVVFSPKPTRVLTDIQVDLPDERNPLSDEFSRLRRDLMLGFEEVGMYEELTESPI
jgi:NitT/TauT family transport system ATP-binding protein